MEVLPTMEYLGVTPLQARLIRALTTERMRKCLHRAGIVLRLDSGHCLTANDMSNDLEILPITIHSTHPIDSEPVHIRSGAFESPGSLSTAAPPRHVEYED